MDTSTLRPFLEWITERHAALGGVTELRILGGPRGVWSAFVSPAHVEETVAALLPGSTGQHPKIGQANFYFGLNPISPQAISGDRRFQRVRTTTRDRDIRAVSLFVVDVDPVRRPRERSASDEEKASALVAVRGANTNNLQDVDVDLPLGVLVVVTGVAGSGKSSLIHGSVVGREGVVAVDQSPIQGSRRSNPATYTGLLEPIRKAFAKANGVKPALFSANSEGACPTCNGAGVIYTDLGMMAGVSTVCEDCEGRRFQAAVLEYRLGGLDIAQVLDLPVKDAVEFFGAGPARIPAAHAILKRMSDVGLGYLRLGQPLPTLSGGERQRLKLATEMGAEGGIYVLDEPTTGLHLADLRQLLGLLDRLVDSGKSVIVIEHHQAVMAHADWIVDLGPGAGHDGGRIVFQGTPADLVRARSTVTGEHLARYVSG